jgi:type I restriction enzyme M protein
LNPIPKLYYPIDSELKISARAKDQLNPTKEKLRIDCIRFLLGKKYPKDNFKIETILPRFRNKGRNSFRIDPAISDCPAKEPEGSTIDELREHILLIAEIKRDNADVSEGYQGWSRRNCAPEWLLGQP